MLWSPTASASSTASPSPTASPSLTASPSPVSPFDVNGDGKLDDEDLILFLRAIADPMGTVKPGDTALDLNKDGAVDFDDAKEILSGLIAANGAASVAPLTPDYNNVHDFNWDQVPLNASTNATVPQSSIRQLISGIESTQQQVCGILIVGGYKKGNDSRPTISWDDGYPLNSSAKATTADYWNWAYYGSLLTNAKALVELPDGTKAYRRYRNATGADLKLNYENAVRDDSAIKSSIDTELQAVKAAVKEMHDGQEASFSFHSTGSRLVNIATENWKKALGGHRIWSKGTVTYSKTPCELKVEITIMMEDFYNFNRGPIDIATGLPDNDNGRFEVFGWAKSFFNRGEITRTETIALPCCGSADCGDKARFDCKCSLCTTQCLTQQRSGGRGFTSFTVDLKKTQGKFELSA